MNSTLTALCVAVISCGFALTQAPSNPPVQPTPSAPTATPPPIKATFDKTKLEKEFSESLRGTTLVGTWQMTGPGGLKSADPLTEPKPDEYVIADVAKAGEDLWVVQAKIGFAKNELIVPVPVRVVWAEDTAIITLNDLPVPMIGTYSARVMIHNGFYSGVWYSNEKNYGGVMQGRIVKKDASQKPADAKPADSPKPPLPSGDRKE